MMELAKKMADYVKNVVVKRECDTLYNQALKIIETEITNKANRGYYFASFYEIWCSEKDTDTVMVARLFRHTHKKYSHEICRIVAERIKQTLQEKGYELTESEWQCRYTYSIKFDDKEDTPHA